MRSEWKEKVDEEVVDGGNGVVNLDQLNPWSLVVRWVSPLVIARAYNIYIEGLK